MTYGQRVQCTMCESEFDEKYIVLIGDVEKDPKEQCPLCKKVGYLEDLD